jgi:hypothetical protein
VGNFNNCSEMEICGEIGCVHGSNVLFEIHQGNTCFCFSVNSCCNCRIPEVPSSTIHVQPTLEALEGSGNS